MLLSKLKVLNALISEERIANQKAYSELMADGRRALVVKWKQTPEEKVYLKEKRHQIRVKQREDFVKRMNNQHHLVINSLE